MSKTSTPEKPIIDGFMYNPLLRYLPMRYLPLVYENLCEFRLGPWQPRLYTVPAGNGGAVINAGVTLTQQVRTAVHGCYLIGYSLATLSDNPQSIGVVVLDADADLPGSGYGTSVYSGFTFMNGIDRYLIGNNYAPASITGASGASGQRFCLLTKPYEIMSDLLTVKLSNLSVTDDIQTQFVLYVMEPFSVTNS